MNNLILKKMLQFLLLLFVSIILIIGIVLFAYSPGNSKPILDQTGNIIVGSISEKIFININGVQQGMFIKSKNEKHPVLLFLHGGMPEYFLNKKYPSGLEDYFTRVWWEQRGSGISYNSDDLPEAITLNQLVNDAISVTNYLRKLFNKDKIYLMGHSGGSFVGIQVAARVPELFNAYIGVGQMSNQLQSEQIVHDYMLEQYKKSDNKAMIKKLENTSIIDSIPNDYLKFRDKAMHNLGIGTTHKMKSVFTGIFMPSLTCKEYTLKEKYNMWSSKSQSGVSILWSEMLATNLLTKVPKLQIPTYFFGGIYDYTVSYTLAKEYLNKLQAPIKGFYTFKNSAHSPIFEEPEKVKQIFELDILKGKTNLADKN